MTETVNIIILPRVILLEKRCMTRCNIHDYVSAPNYVSIFHLSKCLPVLETLVPEDKEARYLFPTRKCEMFKFLDYNVSVKWV